MEKLKFEENSYFKDILDNLYEAMCFLDDRGVIKFWNKAAERLTGYSSSEVIEKPCNSNILLQIKGSRTKPESLFTPAELTLKDAKSRESQFSIRNKNRRRHSVSVNTIPVKNNEGLLIGVIETIRDKTIENGVNERIQELQQLTFFDSLTNIGNRRFADISLKEKMEHYKRNGWIFGIILFDIDGFKAINDNFGHNFGDYVLQTVAEAFTRNIRTPQTSVFRWGGDEFLLINVNVNAHHLITIAERLNNCVKNTAFQHKTGVIRITLSGGAALISDNDDIGSIISRADQALYTSKQTGGNRCFLLQEQNSK